MPIAYRILIPLLHQVAKRKKEKRKAEQLKKDIEEYEDNNFVPYNLTKKQKKLLKVPCFPPLARTAPRNVCIPICSDVLEPGTLVLCDV